MIHGPCGSINPNCSCMKKGKCSKIFPKDYEQETRFDENGFTKYKRRNTDIHVRRNNCNIKNEWVVPYNITLLKRYQAHINVEYVNQSRLLKYLCKVEAIRRMGPIRDLKGVQRVMGCLAALSRFISRLGEKGFAPVPAPKED